MAFSLLCLVGVFLYLNEPLPKGERKAEADAKAREMLTALNVAAWDDVQHIEWTFMRRHHYQWDRQNHQVVVEWGEHRVRVDLARQVGDVLAPKLTTEVDKDKLIRTAIDYFNNDSFWLAAPYKVFDQGTERSLVTLEDGRTGLKVTYTQGGSTPGDSYVWLLDEQNRPTSLKMWVSIIPLGGLEVSWENYLVVDTAAMIAVDHRVNRWLNIELSHVRAR